jgi:hypothetical protein
MSTEQTNKIDFTSLDEDEARVSLTISDHLDWSENEGEHVLLLQEKLNTYLHFIESGKMVETFPWTKGLPVTINVAAKYPMSAEATRFFNLAKGAIENAGFTLEFRHVESGQPQSA